MTTRRFPIPALGALSVGLSGCADPLVGDWNCVRAGDESMPIVNTSGSSYGYYSFTQTLSMGMRVFPDLSGHLLYTYTYAYSYGGETNSSSNTQVLRINAFSQESRRYTITVGPDEDEMDCSLDGDRMTCAEASVDLIFRPAEDDE